MVLRWFLCSLLVTLLWSLEAVPVSSRVGAVVVLVVLVVAAVIVVIVLYQCLGSYASILLGGRDIFVLGMWAPGVRGWSGAVSSGGPKSCQPGPKFEPRYGKAQAWHVITVIIKKERPNSSHLSGLPSPAEEAAARSPSAAKAAASEKEAAASASAVVAAAKGSWVASEETFAVSLAS